MIHRGSLKEATRSSASVTITKFIDAACLLGWLCFVCVRWNSRCGHAISAVCILLFLILNIDWLIVDWLIVILEIFSLNYVLCHCGAVVQFDLGCCLGRRHGSSFKFQVVLKSTLVKIETKKWTMEDSLSVVDWSHVDFSVFRRRLRSKVAKNWNCLTIMNFPQIHSPNDPPRVRTDNTDCKELWLRRSALWEDRRNLTSRGQVF
jgi:hypothetical protein